MSIDSASVSAGVHKLEAVSTGLFKIIETQKQENTTIDHNGLWSNLYTYKDPVSPKCSPYGPLTEQWSPGSPSYSSLQEHFHEESEGTDSTIEEVLYHITCLFVSEEILYSITVVMVVRVGSDTFGDPIFQKGLQN